MVEFTRPQKEIQKAAREFARGEFDRELAREFEKNGIFPDSIWKKMTDLGFLGIHFPERYAGGGLGCFENIIISETLCRKDSSMGSALLLSAHGAECIAMFGKKEQKQEPDCESCFTYFHQPSTLLPLSLSNSISMRWKAFIFSKFFGNILYAPVSFFR